MPKPITTLDELRRAVAAVVAYNWDDEVDDYACNCSDEPGDNQRSGHILHTLLALGNWIHGTADTAEGLLAAREKSREDDDADDLAG